MKLRVGSAPTERRDSRSGQEANVRSDVRNDGFVKRVVVFFVGLRRLL